MDHRGLGRGLAVLVEDPRRGDDEVVEAVSVFVHDERDRAHRGADPVPGVDGELRGQRGGPHEDPTALGGAAAVVVDAVPADLGLPGRRAGIPVVAVSVVEGGVAGEPDLADPDHRVAVADPVPVEVHEGLDAIAGVEVVILVVDPGVAVVVEAVADLDCVGWTGGSVSSQSASDGA